MAIELVPTSLRCKDDRDVEVCLSSALQRNVQRYQVWTNSVCTTKVIFNQQRLTEHSRFSVCLYSVIHIWKD